VQEDQIIIELRGRLRELEGKLAQAQTDLPAAIAKSRQLDQLRNADQERLFVLETEAAKLREQIRRFAEENESLRGVFRSDHFAGPGQMCVSPNLPAKRLGLQGNHGFLIMPFGPRWSTAVEQAVHKALTQCGMECHRGDQLLGPDVMLDIWTWICECGVVVADVTDCNPNVMYELGLAEALGKKIILISQTADPQRLAFDLLGLRLIVYGTEGEGLQELTARLRKAVRVVRGISPRPETEATHG
jgi:hypothetical protein